MRPISDRQHPKGAARLVCKGADNTVRWTKGERLHHLFEARCDALVRAGEADHAAIVTDDETVSFRALDERANQTARYLMAQGLTSGDRVGLLLDKTVESYVALLAVLKINAAYVPLDASFPCERIAFILSDANVKAIVSLSGFADKLASFALPRILLDSAAEEIAAMRAGRPTPTELPTPKDELCYVIYTSGTTGNPKGVAIEHASICNFVRVAGETYGVRKGDRAYQGMTIAFDFSVEELWVPLLEGATLVPGRPGASLVGDDLADDLIERRVTYLACVPTLLATIEKDLPELRILLVSGEACPHNLVVRWHRPGRTILNAYGPTEATVTATLTELNPDKPVTIGGPLPTYTIVILDENEDRALGEGALGEIGIAGVGLAGGYLNLPDLTARKFIPDFIGLPNNPSKRIYRTGDVGRINAAGEVEFHGRIDTQIKVRGYRIELGEIEAALSELPQVAQAVAHTIEPEPGTLDIAAYYTLKQGESGLPLQEAAHALKARLPSYMMPAYLEQLSAIPMTASNKADRKRLPAPKGPRLGAVGRDYVAPRTAMEGKLAEALKQVLKFERVSVVDNFFHDMGAHSLLMARFCSALRRQGENVAIKDIYLNPSIEKLGRYLQAAGCEIGSTAEREPLHVPSSLDYYRCGALQLAYVLGAGTLAFWVLLFGIERIYAAIDDGVQLYLRMLALVVGGSVAMTALPVAAKWLLIGRWREEAIPVWSLRYFRFWLVRSLICSAPPAAFSGTPIYNVYLRLLGARIGRNVILKPRFMPVCTDLISIGDGSVVLKDTILLGYKARSNRIHTGSIVIGANAYVGESSLLDVGTVMEDDTQLAYGSSLQTGQRIARGQRWHGSPAQETHVDYCRVEARPCTQLRRAVYSAVLVAIPLLVILPALIMAVFLLIPLVARETVAHFEGLETSASPWSIPFAELAFVSLGLFLGALVAGLAVVLVVPRLLRPFLRENETYVLYGVRYYVFRLLSLVSNSPLYNDIFGDSSAIVHYLRLVGYRLDTIVQTGSNFGSTQAHENPFMVAFGTGTMVSDRLWLMNAEMSSTSFRLSTVRIGARNYLGNDIRVPAGHRVGDNCLLASKVMVPIDGPVRENVGLLGSPAFEIPRAVERDRAVMQAWSEEGRRAQIRRKNVHNLVTMVAYLGSVWVFLLLWLIAALLAVVGYQTFGVAVLLAFNAIMLPATVLYFVVTERASLGFRRLTPREVAIYDRYFWSHERYWKFQLSPLRTLFPGTPMRSLIWRLLGMKVGAKLFDDGCTCFETSLIEIGDYANLNVATTLQGHSLEEGLFKSDHIRIGDGCTVGAAALVLYGVAIGDNVVIEPDSFLMKGESPASGTMWGGNPAREMRSPAAHATLISVPLLEPAVLDAA